MPELEQSLGRESSTDHTTKHIHGLTHRYIDELRDLPRNQLLQIRSSYPSLANILKIKSADERVKAEKDKFYKRFTDFIDGYRKYLPPDEYSSSFMGVFTRIVCVTAGGDLIVVANQEFDDFPYFRNPIIQSARDVFLYGAKISQEYKEEIDQSWLNVFILDVVMQSAAAWKASGSEEFPERIAQFREPRLVC